jgi:hypothetical protein
LILAIYAPLIYTAQCVTLCIAFDAARIKSIMHRDVRINHRCIGGFMYKKKPRRGVSGPILWGVGKQVHKGT